MKYSNYDIKTIEKTLVMFEDKRTVEEFVAELEDKHKNLPKFDKETEKDLITLRNNKDLLTPGSIRVINKLLGDKKIRNKIKLIGDGSYLSNRIWIYADGDSINISISLIGLYDEDFYDDLYHMNTNQKITWMYNHYDTIFLQISVDCESRESLLSGIELEKELADIDEMVDYDD